MPTLTDSPCQLLPRVPRPRQAPRSERLVHGGDRGSARLGGRDGREGTETSRTVAEYDTRRWLGRSRELRRDCPGRRSSRRRQRRKQATRGQSTPLALLCRNRSCHRALDRPLPSSRTPTCEGRPRIFAHTRLAHPTIPEFTLTDSTAPFCLTQPQRARSVAVTVGLCPRQPSSRPTRPRPQLAFRRHHSSPKRRLQLAARRRRRRSTLRSSMSERERQTLRRSPPSRIPLDRRLVRSRSRQSPRNVRTERMKAKRAAAAGCGTTAVNGDRTPPQHDLVKHADCQTPPPFHDQSRLWQATQRRRRARPDEARG